MKVLLKASPTCEMLAVSEIEGIVVDLDAVRDFVTRCREGISAMTPEFYAAAFWSSHFAAVGVDEFPMFVYDMLEQPDYIDLPAGFQVGRPVSYELGQMNVLRDGVQWTFRPEHADVDMETPVLPFSAFYNAQTIVQPPEPGDPLWIDGQMNTQLNKAFRRTDTVDGIFNAYDENGDEHVVMRDPKHDTAERRAWKLAMRAAAKIRA